MYGKCQSLRVILSVAMEHRRRIQLGCTCAALVVILFLISATSLDQRPLPGTPETTEQLDSQAARVASANARFVPRTSVKFNKQVDVDGLIARQPWMSDRMVRLHDGPHGWPRPWTALTFSGNMRSFAYPAVISSLRNNVIDALGGTVLVLMNVRLTDQARSGINCVNSEDDLFGALQELLGTAPENFIVWRECELFPPDSAPLCPDGSKSATTPSYSQIMTLADSFSLVLDYEVRQTLQCDVMVFCLFTRARTLTPSSDLHPCITICICCSSASCRCRSMSASSSTGLFEPEQTLDTFTLFQR